MKLKQPRYLWKTIILVATMLLVGAGVFIGWRLLSEKPSPMPTIELTKPSETHPEPQFVTLPGAQPIVAMDGDYTDDAHVWRLVNKSHPLTDTHCRPNIAKPNVPTRTDKSLDEQSVRTNIVPHVETLFEAAAGAGFELQIGSGFRDYDLQKMYYDNYSRVYGQEAADTFSAKPGYSEHQTGLVIDVSETSNHCYLQECFGDTEAGKWLVSNAHLHGFILRYPRDKDGITDFHYEPWHFRYVGTPLATALYESKLTLDEAAPYLAQARQD